MNIREWALLIFSILGQLAAGMLLVLLIVRAGVVRKVGVEKAAQLTNPPLYMVLLIMILALLASLFHLGKLAHVIGAVPNLGTSWLSREVVAAVAFVVALAVYALLLWRKIGSEGFQSVIGWITALTGLFLIYCTGVVYLLPAQPAWNTLATPVTFFVTALLLGVLGAATALMLNYAKVQKKDAALQEFVKSTLQWIAIAAIILLGIEFLVLPIYLAYLGTQGTAALQTLNLLVGSYGSTLALRLLLVFAGAGVLAAYLYRNASMAGQEKLLATLTYSAFALVLISEILGRFLFYATHYRIGV
ncbi:MAG: dimethyl sulfoxide reductase anchor subunit family protein [Anaerolineales bacterium]